MAEIIESHDFRNGHGNQKYPWADWGNGEVWRITQGSDFSVAPRVMQGQIKVRGTKEKRKTVTNVQGDVVVFAFQRHDESEADFTARTKPPV